MANVAHSITDVNELDVASNWVLHEPGDGQPAFYWNRTTGETSWTDPDAAAPEEKDLPPNWLYVQGDDGLCYYFNHETGMTQWDQPADYKVVAPTTAAQQHALPEPHDAACTEAMLAIVNQEVSDAHVNELAWSCLGYARNGYDLDTDDLTVGCPTREGSLFVFDGSMSVCVRSSVECECTVVQACTQCTRNLSKQNCHK